MSDRHEKWVAVEPGTVIPAGQPHRVEFSEPVADFSLARTMTAKELIRTKGFTVPSPLDSVEREWFVDSSWKPPLVLPTEPTWGIVLLRGPDRAGDEHRLDFGRWQADLTGRGTLERTHRSPFDTRCDVIARESVLDFIPLSPEQVKRIEAAS